MTCMRMYNVSLETWKKRALQEKNGYPALNWAARYNHPSLVHYLCTEFPAADVDYAPNRTPPLMWAIHHDNATIVQMLLEYYADCRGFSLLIHAAAEQREAQALQVILDRVRAYPESMPGINDRCPRGSTALHVAAHYGAIRAATLLLDYGADIDSTGARLLTPLGIAVRDITERTVSMATLLLSRGANVEGRTSENANIWFDTPLHVALRSVEWHSDSVVRLLLAHGAAIDSISASGDTTMMSAVNGADPIEKMSSIIGRGGDINMLDSEGSSAVHFLADSDEGYLTRSMLLFFEENGADMFLANESGMTPRDFARDIGWDSELIEDTWGNSLCARCRRSCTQ